MTRSSALTWIGGTAGAIVVAAMLGPIVTTASAASSETALPVAARAHAAAPMGAAQAARPVQAGATSTQARAAVLAQVPKARIVSVRQVHHRGVAAFAVRIQRTDGSSLVGYVDTATGTVYAWRTLAPAAMQSFGNESSSNASDTDSDDSTMGEEDSEDGPDEDADENDNGSDESRYDDDGGSVGTSDNGSDD